MVDANKKMDIFHNGLADFGKIKKNEIFPIANIIPAICGIYLRFPF
jgi:hypothetical protein